MDFVTEKQFNFIFDRESGVIDFKGCKNEEDINRKLKQKAKQELQTVAKNPIEKIKAQQRANYHLSLIPGFAKRVIDEAIANPYGIFGLTLKYGRLKAKTFFSRYKRRN
jgi:hypothetical protein